MLQGHSEFKPASANSKSPCEQTDRQRGSNFLSCNGWACGGRGVQCVWQDTETPLGACWVTVSVDAAQAHAAGGLVSSSSAPLRSWQQWTPPLLLGDAPVQGLAAHLRGGFSRSRPLAWGQEIPSPTHPSQPSHSPGGVCPQTGKKLCELCWMVFLLVQETSPFNSSIFNNTLYVWCSLIDI